MSYNGHVYLALFLAGASLGCALGARVILAVVFLALSAYAGWSVLFPLH